MNFRERNLGGDSGGPACAMKAYRESSAKSDSRPYNPLISSKLGPTFIIDERYNWQASWGYVIVIMAKMLACSPAGVLTRRRDCEILRRVLGFLVPTAGRTAARRFHFDSFRFSGIAPQHFQCAHFDAVIILVKGDAPFVIGLKLWMRFSAILWRWSSRLLSFFRPLPVRKNSHLFKLWHVLLILPASGCRSRAGLPRRSWTADE
jgi:hypothetical protein